MAKFLMSETITGKLKAITARLGAGSGAANNWTSKEVGKIVKFVGESRYNLAAAGDPIEGFVSAVEVATQDGFTIGSVFNEGLKEVTFDGLQATPGVGVVALGDYVVTGSVVAKDTALTGPAKVCKATNQPGAVPGDLTAAAGQIKNALFGWRVVSLGAAGTGAVGTTGLIKRENAAA